MLTIFNCACVKGPHKKAVQVRLLGEASPRTSLTPIPRQANHSALNSEEASQACSLPQEGGL